MNQADAELARMWADRGDRAAMKALYDRHAEKVYAFARGMTGSGDKATEVVQETFLRAARACGRFRGQSQFSTWLLSVARSVVHDFGRSAARRSRDADLDPPFRSNPGPDRNLDSRELTETVRRAVMRLPERERAAVTLCELQDLPLADAAVVLGWKVGRLKSVLFRARGRLKKDLAPYMS
ncbi:MAG: RNA polymerase sigma factor [Planctomycetota bacterium]|jgi:RNA polymerase sigma-70 factor (ECF subfamily)